MKEILEGDKEECMNSINVENFVPQTFKTQDAIYTCDIAKVLTQIIIEENEDSDEKLEKLFIEHIKIILSKDEEFGKKFKVNNSKEGEDVLLIASKPKISLEEFRRRHFPKKEDIIKNKFGELGYVETGEEQKIAIEAGNSRPYTDFFDEYVPNTKKESERAHKYTVSLHKALCYEENLEVYRKFEWVRFSEENTRHDFLKFQVNSPLYDPRDPEFENVRTCVDS